MNTPDSFVAWSLPNAVLKVATTVHSLYEFDFLTFEFRIHGDERGIFRATAPRRSVDLVHAPEVGKLNSEGGKVLQTHGRNPGVGSLPFQFPNQGKSGSWYFKDSISLI